MTAPTPPPAPDITEAVRLGNEFQSHRTAILTLGIVILAILFAGLFREKGFSDQIHAEGQAAARFNVEAKSNAAKAMFWQSEASKRSAAVVHDTQVVTKLVASAPRYIYTDTGMRQVPLAPAVPVQDAYTRAADYDSLAAAAATMHHDFLFQIAAMDSGLRHVELGLADETKRGDTLVVAVKAANRRAKLNIVKAGGIGVGFGFIACALLCHH